MDTQVVSKYQLRFLALLAIAICLCPLTAFAQSDSTGDIDGQFDSVANEDKADLPQKDTTLTNGVGAAADGSGLPADNDQTSSDSVSVGVAPVSPDDELSDSSCDPEGSSAVIDGWFEKNGERYYLQAGVPVKGSQYIDGYWYRFDLTHGKMLNGWQSFDERTYYYNTSGQLQFGSCNIDGDWYWFDLACGWMCYGSQNIYGDWYRYDTSCGKMLFGSQNIDGDWYRYDLGCGKMLFGSQNIDGDWYRYDLGCGKMLFGSQNVDGDWYRYDTSCGKMLFGWQYFDNDTHYYSMGDGKLKFGGQFINGYWYWFNGAGVLDRDMAIDTLMRTAHSLLGVPYVWLGVYPQDGGMDCASFVWYLYKQLGITIGFETYYSVSDGFAVSLQNAKPGDLIFMYYSWRGPEHVVLYAGNGMIYEEPDFGGHCQLVPLASKNASDIYVRRILND